MKIIGMLEDGSRLMSVTLTELGTLAELAGAVSAILPAVIETQEPEASAKETVKEPVARRVHKAKKLTAKSPAHICVVCKKPLDNSYSPLAKTHNGACKQKYAKDYARNHYREKNGILAVKKKQPKVLAMPDGNPADPMLSKEERETLLARRLELIKRAAQAHKED